jgi:hypothetical protein
MRKKGSINALSKMIRTYNIYYQQTFGFPVSCPTIDQLSKISRIIKKNYEFRQNVWQVRVFVSFKKVYDIIHRESVFNIMAEFKFPAKLITLTTITMVWTCYAKRWINSC